jgi:cobalt-zinc-cadmium efflux system membrane fusion protein
MISLTKALVALAAVGLFSVIGVREFSAACGPAKPAADAHGHGDATHADEGFGAKVCEDGLATALKEKVGFGTQAMAIKSAPETGEAKHAEGDKHDEKGHAGQGAEKAAAGAAKDEHGHEGGGHGAEGGEGFVKLTAAQIAATGIDMAPVMSGALIKEIAVPGRIAINANGQAKIVPKLAGTVAKVTKQVGDMVAEGEVIATLESREIADAKGEYLAARRTEELAKSTFEREERLWKQKVTAEQDYLNVKNGHQEALIKRDLAHQRLHTVGLSEDEIAKLPTASNEANYRFYDIRSPIAGRVIARDIVMGQIVGTDREAFSIADLATVWVEISISPADLTFAKEGQDVRVSSGGKTAMAKVVAINPAIDAETRSAKVIATLDNPGGQWRLGDFVNAQLISGKLDVPLIVPREAIQTVNGQKVVFVNDGPGFRMRPVTTGREDSTNAEILSGLEFGETVATSNTFTLKAELGKAEAEHEH